MRRFIIAWGGWLVLCGWLLVTGLFLLLAVDYHQPAAAAAGTPDVLSTEPAPHQVVPEGWQQPPSAS